MQNERQKNDHPISQKANYLSDAGWRAKVGLYLILIANFLMYLKRHIIKLISFILNYLFKKLIKILQNGLGLKSWAFIVILVLGFTALYPEIAQKYKDLGSNVNDYREEYSGISHEEGEEQISPPPSDLLEPVPENEVVLPAEPQFKVSEFIVKKGETLDKILANAGFNPTEREAIAVEVRKNYSPKNIKPGDIIKLRLNQDNSFHDLSLEIGQDSILWVRYDTVNGHYNNELVKIPQIIYTTHVQGEINNSLYADATAQGVSLSILAEMIKLFSFDVDFQREIQKNDRYELFYEQSHNSKGVISDSGKIKYASLTLSGKKIDYYRFEGRGGEKDLVEFFNQEGKTARKGLLKTPIDGARLSSSFGARKHPILGYTKMHKGTDFAAPTGTPIYAAGDGVVEYAGRNGNYGNYVRINHNNGYSTAYAHLKAFGKGIKKGVRVQQYQVIGQVGTTGRSTGPHLHYEVLIDGKHVNPMTIKIPTAVTLKGKELDNFQIQKKIIAEDMLKISNNSENHFTQLIANE